ncbi:hypothetical protein PGC35_19725 [Psychrobacillus sp. PGGUH221]|uniref:hypothetical protein n=1 Tax=Psychrobacillus sp. PGGUH221 TaxID=3020058 RepID=UPI0035C77BB6
MSECIINLENDLDKEESFEITGDNIALVHVMDNSGNDITENCRVRQYGLTR